MADQTDKTDGAIDIIGAPLTLPCGLTLPNRLVKCPMQETMAVAPFFDPPMKEFENLYTQWAAANYGLIITGQVQIDIRFLSVTGDVVCHDRSHEAPHIAKWKRWAEIAQSKGTPCIVQLAHPGRMSRAGAGIRPADMPTMCPSSVPVKIGDSWLDKLALDKVLGVPKAMTVEEIDQVVGMFKQGARVAVEAGFKGVQIHGAHGFLVSQFLSPHTNRRTDDYGGTPYKRMALLRRLVTELRELVPKPLCLAVKLNSADYMGAGRGLQMEEGLDQIKWLVECGMVDFVEISGGNAENVSSGLHQSFRNKTIDKAPKRSSTRIREGFFNDFAEKVRALDSSVPIQLSGGFRSRNGMADAIESGVCDMIGLGRAAVLQPELPRAVLLNKAIVDDDAVAISHQVRGLWFAQWFPVKVVGSGFALQFFYHTMRRLGKGLRPEPDLSIPGFVARDALETFRSGLWSTVQRLLTWLPAFSGAPVEKID